MTPLDRDLGRYAPAPQPSLADLDQRLSNVEQILLSMQAQATPKWLRTGGWVTIAGSVLGIALERWLGQ